MRHRFTIEARYRDASEDRRAAGWRHRSRDRGHHGGHAPAW